MSSSFYAFESHHSTSLYGKRTTMHSSRGNTSKATPRDKATSFSQSASASPSTPGHPHNNPKELKSIQGRGGAGDVYYNSSEWAIFSFDEELERQLRCEKEAAPIFHVGRGGNGAGDMRHPTREYTFTAKKRGEASIGSNSSAGSGMDRATEKSRRNVEKGLGKMIDISS